MCHLEIFGVFDEGHAEEIGNFSGEVEAVFFVKAHGALERLGGIERNARAPYGDQVFLRGFEQALRDAAPVRFRRHSHSAEVALRGGDRSGADSPNNMTLRVDGNEHSHGC